MDHFTPVDFGKLLKLPQSTQLNILWLVHKSTSIRNQDLEEFRLKDVKPPDVLFIPARPRPPIFRPGLPNELITLILEKLDLYSLRSFSLVNSACLPLVKTTRRYRELQSRIPQFFSILHQLHSTNLLSEFENFVELLSNGKCHACKEAFAPFIYVPGCNRCCFDCLRKGGTKDIPGWFPIPLSAQEALEFDTCAEGRGNHLYLPNEKMIRRGFTPYVVEDKETGESRGIWSEKVVAPTRIWEDGCVGIFEKRLKHTVFAPVFDSKEDFWDCGLQCIGCYEVSITQKRFALIGGGVNELLRHMVNCNDAVTMLWGECQQILGSILEFVEYAHTE
ncbi:hypothetical protein BJ508DRAFT_173917 [Ascobolus immersus RN42]|uniref:F-box domain-containing protein n=1 Tax=Ascobolus immersus RN42 TaxID=1160509 RepID=A0A3N4HVP2_ASCIM|nr:hypothetical protein BJ508DRAFT_173917 [Ascobolus immersus RN42]